MYTPTHTPPQVGPDEAALQGVQLTAHLLHAHDGSPALREPLKVCELGSHKQHQALTVWGVQISVDKGAPMG